MAVCVCGFISEFVIFLFAHLTYLSGIVAHKREEHLADWTIRIEKFGRLWTAPNFRIFIELSIYVIHNPLVWFLVKDK